MIDGYVDGVALAAFEQAVPVGGVQGVGLSADGEGEQWGACVDGLRYEQGMPVGGASGEGDVFAVGARGEGDTFQGVGGDGLRQYDGGGFNFGLCHPFSGFQHYVQLGHEVREGEAYRGETLGECGGGHDIGGAVACRGGFGRIQGVEGGGGGRVLFPIERGFRIPLPVGVQGEGYAVTGGFSGSEGDVATCREIRGGIGGGCYFYG